MRSLIPILSVMVILASYGWDLASAAASAAPVAPATATSLPESDAAARHAKRTACLKEAKARKLIGAKKAAFLKDCVAAP